MIQSISHITNVLAAIDALGSADSAEIINYVISNNPEAYKIKREMYDDDSFAIGQIASEIRSRLLHIIRNPDTYSITRDKIDGKGQYVYKRIESDFTQTDDVGDGVIDDVSDDEVASVDSEVFDRLAIEKEGESKLSTFDLNRYYEFWEIAKQLNKLAGEAVFDVDHARSIKENGIEAIHPDNLHIINKTANRKKSSKSIDRPRFDCQKEHIFNTINCIRYCEPLTADEDRWVEYQLRRLAMIYS